MNQAYATRDAKRARRQLETLARQLEHQHPGAAASLREGLEETLTVMRLGLPENLERVLSSTNLIENLFSRVREIGRRVRRWQTASASSPAIARSRSWSPRCAPTMFSSIVPSAGLTIPRRPLK